MSISYRHPLRILSLAVLFVLLVLPRPAYAAEITVGPDCTLVQAIQSANTDTSVGSCTAGNGADIIVLDGTTYSYTTPFDTSLNALPEINSTITIEGNGATIAGLSSASFRIFRVITSGGNLTLNNATVTEAYTTANGAAIFNSGVTTFNNVTIHNTNSGNGGAVRNSSAGTVVINNSTISGNSGTNGAAVNNSGSLTLNNSTITGNTASTSGGGIFANGETITLNRTIISGNSSPTGAEVYLNIGTITAANQNVVGYGGSNRSFGFTPSGTDVVPAGALDTVLNTTLANNGGPTLTHALVLGSPAIDLIPTTDPNCNPPTTTDQRGAVRADGANRGGAACDAGSFEFDSNLTPTAVALVSFTAVNQQEGGAALDRTGQILLSWETASEFNVSGFRLHRSTSIEGPYAPVAESELPATGYGIEGGHYSFMDTPGEGSFFYNLEVIDADGSSIFYGPVEAMVSLFQHIFLPMVGRE